MSREVYFTPDADHFIIMDLDYLARSIHLVK